MSKGFASNYRIVVLASLVLLCFGGLGARLVWLHVIDREELLAMVEKARREVTIQKARRGDILDNKGNILATSRSLIDLGVDPQLLRKSDEKKWPQLAAQIGMPLFELEKVLQARMRPEGPDGGERPVEWASLSDQISESTYADIVKLGIAGVYGNRVYRRDYPHNELAAHVIGYVNREEQPVTGIESYLDFYLHGQNGWVETEKDGRQVELAQFRTREVPASDGYSVSLSIDAIVQHIAEAEVQDIVAKFHPQKVTIIVGIPRTGEIRALANYPTFNLNEYNKVPKDEQRSLRNVAVSDMYEPGSVFKIVAASGALNEGIVTPATTFDCSLDELMVNGVMRKLPGEDTGEHFSRETTVADIIALSSNKGAAQLGVLLGDRRFYNYARAFGFGRVTGFPAGGETRGLLVPPEKWDGLTITRMPIGQGGIAATPLQMHQAMGVIASGGVLLRPQLIEQIRDASGAVVYNFGRAEVRRVISANTAHIMAGILSRVTQADGTGKMAAIPGYDVAGKTGTAEKLVNGQYSRVHHVGSFIGFFPARDPQVAISVIVDDADESFMGKVAHGALVAGPAFKHIGEQLIPYLDIQPALAGAGLGSGRSLAMEGGRR